MTYIVKEGSSISIEWIVEYIVLHACSQYCESVYLVVLYCGKSLMMARKRVSRMASNSEYWMLTMS